MFCVWAAEGEDYLREGWAAQAERVMLCAGDKATTKEPREKGETHLWVKDMAFEAWIAPKEQKCCQNGRNWPGRALPPEWQQAEHREIDSETQKGEGSAAGDGNLPLEEWERSFFSLDSERQSPGPLLRATRTVLFWGT